MVVNNLRDKVHYSNSYRDSHGVYISLSDDRHWISEWPSYDYCCHYYSTTFTLTESKINGHGRNIVTPVEEHLFLPSSHTANLQVILQICPTTLEFLKEKAQSGVISSLDKAETLGHDDLWFPFCTTIDGFRRVLSAQFCSH